jgi:membrane-associated phospholipid phosphatase
MNNSARLTLHLRLEDAVALVFFLLSLLLRIIFRGLEAGNFSPADVLIVIPAVTLLIAKELVHYFFGGKPGPAAGSEGPWDFLRPFWVIVRDWFPFLVILLMYYSLWGDATLLMVTRDRDPALIALDQRIFGFQASIVLQRFISPGLTAWMAFAYFFHIINIPLVGCFLYTRRERSRFREMMSGLMVVSFLGLLGYLLVPAIGPMYTLRDRYTVPLHQSLWVFDREVDFMDFARIRRDVFPSMHVAISFLVWLYAYRNSRKLFWILSPVIISLWVSTLYLRYHYMVDVAAGLVLAPISFWIGNTLFRRVGEIPISFTVPGRIAERLPRVSTSAAENAQEGEGPR